MGDFKSDRYLLMYNDGNAMGSLIYGGYDDLDEAVDNAGKTDGWHVHDTVKHQTAWDMMLGYRIYSKDTPLMKGVTNTFADI